MRGTQVSGGKITFHYRPELGSWRLRPSKQYKRWLRLGLMQEAHRRGHPLPEIAHLAYYFVPLSEIQALHQRLMGDPEPTDILTLDYREGAEAPWRAELFVCPSFVKFSAQRLRLSFGEELRRVLAHGLLHLLGYRDDSPADRLRMRAAEERWLALWNTLIDVSHETGRV